MRDLEIAKKELKNSDLTLVIVKKGKTIFRSTSSGIGGFLQAVEDLKGNLRGSSAADRIVGRAAALLLSYSNIKEVYAGILSSEGLKILEENGISVEHDHLVPKILGREGIGICPFEEFASTIKSPENAYELLKRFRENLLRK